MPVRFISSITVLYEQDQLHWPLLPVSLPTTRAQRTSAKPMANNSSPADALLMQTAHPSAVLATPPLVSALPKRLPSRMARPDVASLTPTLQQLLKLRRHRLRSRVSKFDEKLGRIEFRD